MTALNKNFGLGDEMKYEDSSVVTCEYSTDSKEQMLLTCLLYTSDAADE